MARNPSRYDLLETEIQQNATIVALQAKRVHDRAGHDPRTTQRLAAARQAANLAALTVDALVVQAFMDGRSWGEIAAALGTSRQAAHKKYGTYVLSGVWHSD